MNFGKENNMGHYFRYLHTICETFDSNCNGCKYHIQKRCFLRQTLNSNNDYFFISVPEIWTIQDFNRINKKKMVFLEGI